MLIDAFAQIAHLCEGWTIVIYGDGNDKFSLLEKIRNLKLDGRIFICPPVDDIYNEYQHSDFFVLSSRFEGLPLVLGEAMACGIPCVAFRCKYGPEDIIDDGKNGLLVENGNIKDLGEKMLWMIEHKEERLCMGERARKDIKRLEKDPIMKIWLDLFQSYEEMMN
jgi:glycosyltransferase involved in cell wall biosynthesis